MSVTSQEVEDKIYTLEQLSSLDSKQVPRHIAFIPDGNRRWAKKISKDASHGHQKGADILLDIVKACKEMGVQTATFFLFSTENWTRPKTEVHALMWLLKKYLIQERPRLIKNGVKLSAIGETSKLPKRVQTALKDTIEATAHCEDIEVVFALNYGARDEICRAVGRIVDDIEKDALSKEEITEKVIGQYLDTSKWEDPDLLIRTSGEMRVSNFLLWQISYTEVFISPAFWPEFTPDHLLGAVLDYQNREKRRGV